MLSFRQEVSFVILKNGNVFLDGKIKKCDVRFSQSIIGIGEFADEEYIDAEGKFVFPGFIDIHTHGGGGGDFMDAEEESFEGALRFHAENGTTSVLATSVTAPVADIEKMLAVTRKFMNKKTDRGARVIGAHVEGPYISLKNKGAQHERHLRVPALDPYGFILDSCDVIKTVTVSPELDGAAEMIEKMTAKGIVVSGGHDDGYFEKVKEALDAGMTHCTHIWCAMSGAKMRNGKRTAGLLETALLSDKLTVEVIADNCHISPLMLELIYKLKGSGKMCLVSDCLRGGGMKEDERLYKLGSKNDPDAVDFIVSGGVARLPDNSRLAGSVMPLAQMLKNVVRDAKIPLEEAVKTVTDTPAEIIHEKNIGKIKPGNKADFCIMSKDLVPLMTIIDGKTVYEKGRC